jgi:hypothetical protein
MLLLCGRIEFLLFAFFKVSLDLLDILSSVGNDILKNWFIVPFKFIKKIIFNTEIYKSFVLAKYIVLDVLEQNYNILTYDILRC